MMNKKIGHILRRVSDFTYVAQAGSAGRALGSADEVRRYEALRELLDRHRLTIRTILYVGANEGQEAELLLRACPKAILHCFEPQTRCQGALEQLSRRWPGRVHVHAVALSDAEGSALLTRPASHHQASSLLRPNEEMGQRFPHVTGWSDETVVTTRLDAWVADHDITEQILVKMDVQGAEQLVMAGGEDVFARAGMVIAELAVVPTYEGAPLMTTVFDELTRRGFGYAGELGQVRDEDYLVVEFDGAFVRPRSQRRATLTDRV